MPLTNHVGNICALEGVFAEQDVIKRWVGLLRQLIDTTNTQLLGGIERRKVSVVVGVMLVDLTMMM